MPLNVHLPDRHLDRHIRNLMHKIDEAEEAGC